MPNDGAINLAGFPGLKHTTGDQAADLKLTSLVAAFESSFQGQGLNYHLLGSYAEGSATPVSDLDVIILFPGGLLGEEAAESERILRDLAARPGPRLDVEPRGELDLNPIWAVALASGSVRLFGNPETPVQMPSVADYAWALVEDVCSLIRRLRSRQRSVAFPVDYPDPEGVFFGYEQKPLLTASGAWVPSS